jgi:di/tricarboxylate transporter
MPSSQIILVSAVIIGTVVLFVTGKLRFDVIALCVLGALLVLGLIRPDQALYGFASPATATVAAMFVLSAGLVRTGLVQWLARRIDRLAGKGEFRLVLVLCAVIAGLSAFVVNTATVAFFIPVAIVLARARKISPARVLMPLSFASQFGGVCTLIGTSTNILVNSIAVSHGMDAFGMFEFAPLGLVMAAAGIVYLLVVGHCLLPRRRRQIQQIDKYRLADYLAELRVTSKSPLAGQTWEDSEAIQDKDLQLIKLLRAETATWRPNRTKIESGDILLVHGHVDRLIALAEKFKLESRAQVTLSDKQLSSDEVQLVEALVPPRSSLAGRPMGDSDLRRRFGLIPLAVQRRGRVLRDRLARIRLGGGDTLLLQGDRKGVERLMRSSDLIVTNELTELYFRKDRAVLALLLLAAVVALAALKIVPILVAAIIGALVMILSGCLTVEEAYRAIDWKVIFLLGGILPLGLAMEQSGAAGWLAGGALGFSSAHGPLLVLAILYITTAVLTEIMSNNAAAVLLAPIALSMAAAMGADARPFLVAITFAASTSFATPVGYQTNTMVFAPGGYRFADFTKLGGPLNLVFWALAVLLIPVIWPF